MFERAWVYRVHDYYNASDGATLNLPCVRNIELSSPNLSCSPSRRMGPFLFILFTCSFACRSVRSDAVALLKGEYARWPALAAIVGGWNPSDASGCR